MSWHLGHTSTDYDGLMSAQDQALVRGSGT